MKKIVVKPKRLKTNIEPSKLYVAMTELNELARQAQLHELRKVTLTIDSEILKDITHD